MSPFDSSDGLSGPSAFPAFARAADQLRRDQHVRYSICTLVNRPEEYCRMVQSFQAGGFVEPDCEYLYLDNSRGNRFDAYSGLNLFLTVARGAFVILCHQDVELLEDGRDRLDRMLAELSVHDPQWGLCGNAGGVRPGRVALRITDPNNNGTARGGPFPAKVTSLDENFIIARRDANLALSRDLEGFHFYGADICLIATVLGYQAYVIDFHLQHKSQGRPDQHFHDLRGRLVAKYQAALRPRWVTTTCTLCYLSSWRLLNMLANSCWGRVLARKIGRMFG